MKTVLSFDFGASSGRAIKAEYDGEKLSYGEIHRFENVPVERDGHIFHNVDMMLGEINTAFEKAGKVDSLAFDTWGVDYALIDGNGKMLSIPYHYRDVRTSDVLSFALKKMPADELYLETGNQIMPINTLFQLLCDENVKNAETLLFMPDLFGYLLTGKKACEYTIASTSQMLNPKTKNWGESVLEKFGISKTLFAPLTKTGSVLGKYKGADVVSVAGHDTQCAVAAMPTNKNERAAFLSCGTWSLIGCETDAPVLTQRSRELELSNEIGADGKINYLKNISGLWLIQELKRELAERGKKYSYNEFEMLARKSEPFKCFIDPDDPSLSARGGLYEKIRKYCLKTGQTQPETTGEVVRCIYESLALKYRLALNQISECTDKAFNVLHVLGGGTKDNFLCEMTADCTGIPVIAGPVEATALGNIILQLVSAGELSDVSQGRELIGRTEKLITYEPCPSAQWDGAYEKYFKIISE